MQEHEINVVEAYALALKIEGNLLRYLSYAKLEHVGTKHSQPAARRFDRNGVAHGAVSIEDRRTQPVSRCFRQVSHGCSLAKEQVRVPITWLNNLRVRVGSEEQSAF